MRRFDVCIVGGGAAGLAAAALIKKELRVCILEKNEILGRKLAATGGGRCNLTNEACSGKSATLDFFASIGIETYCDDEGRYYPYTNKAQDVVKALEDALGSNVSIFCGVNVDGISKESGRFTVSAGKEAFSVDKIILATGGKAAPQYGTAGDGYRFAKALGHTVAKVYPALAPVECADDEWAKMKPAKGVRAKASVRLLFDGESLTEVPAETGELQFSEDGLSGICVFNLSSHIRVPEGEKIDETLSRYSISVDLAPDFTAEELASRNSSFGILTGQLAAVADDEMRKRDCGVGFIKDWRFTVKNVKGWRYAQCSAGGVETSEIDMNTMESKLSEGLYITGEVLDVLGPCGGFNLQNAWETAMKAAEDINSKAGR